MFQLKTFQAFSETKIFFSDRYFKLRKGNWNLNEFRNEFKHRVITMKKHPKN